MGAPTELDWENFSQKSEEQKAKVLFTYLYEGVQGIKRAPRMDEVDECIFGKGDGWDASCIMRCYGFDGNNSLYYKKKGYILEWKDFKDFVRAYRNGCPGDHPKHEIMDDFMARRSQKNQQRNFNSVYNNEPDDDDEWFTPNTTGAANQANGNQGNDEEEKLSDNDAMAIGICAIIAVILIYIFRKKIYEFIIGIMPLVVLIVILAVVIKLVFFGGKKKKDNSQASSNYERGGGGNGYSERESDGANWHFEFKMSNVLTCAIFWFIGFGGLTNGAADNTGSLVIAVILIVLGFLAIYRKN